MLLASHTLVSHFLLFMQSALHVHASNLVRMLAAMLTALHTPESHAPASNYHDSRALAFTHVQAYDPDKHSATALVLKIAVLCRFLGSTDSQAAAPCMAKT